MAKVVRQVIPTDLKAARRVAEDIMRQVERNGYGPEECFAIRLAVEEAIINAVKHGNKFDPGKSLTVSAEVGDRLTAITIADEGQGFDPVTVPDPTADENLEKPCGRGIMLIESYMNKVHWNKRGNQVEMVKRNE